MPNITAIIVICCVGRKARPVAARKEGTRNQNQTRGPLTPAEEFKYAKLAMKWYGWGSPIGLGIALVALAAAALLFRIAIFGF
ncbi:hypothetical protein NKI01_12275 [Mesorhizobium sp. M0815]|uniref:hypothetical protein n=1 Tax=unclassified Mesorhizobium TaxID=325217 RepID=UPI0033384EE3